LEILNSHKGKRVDGDRTICEVHRTLADILILRLKDQPAVLDEIMPLLNDAYKMGIKLVLALIERKIALPEWEKNNVALAMKLRKERNRLVKELNEIGALL
jgi:hypothetical protein